jgi:hypothetical protein
MPSCRSSSSRPRSRILLAATVLVLTAACSEPEFSLPTSTTVSDSTSTTATDTTATPLTFSGTLEVRGHRFYSFTVPSTRTVRLTLEQLQTGAGPASTATLTLGLGIPSGTGCALLREIGAAASEEPQIDEALTAGIYCTQLADPGSLTEAVLFSIRIDFP